MKKNNYFLLIVLLLVTCENSQDIPEIPDQRALHFSITPELIRVLA